MYDENFVKSSLKYVFRIFTGEEFGIHKDDPEITKKVVCLNIYRIISRKSVDENRIHFI